MCACVCMCACVVWVRAMPRTSRPGEDFLPEQEQPCCVNKENKAGRYVSVRSAVQRSYAYANDWNNESAHCVFVDVSQLASDLAIRLRHLPLGLGAPGGLRSGGQREGLHA